MARASNLPLLMIWSTSWPELTLILSEFNMDQSPGTLVKMQTPGHPGICIYTTSPGDSVLGVPGPFFERICCSGLGPLQDWKDLLL